MDTNDINYSLSPRQRVYMNLLNHGYACMGGTDCPIKDRSGTVIHTDHTVHVGSLIYALRKAGIPVFKDKAKLTLNPTILPGSINISW